MQDKGWDFVNDFEDYCKDKLSLSMGHMKWTKIPPLPEGKYYNAYKKMIELFFQYSKNDTMSYRVIIAESGKYNFKSEEFFQGDYEEGFYNLYCQLILNWIQKGNEYNIRIAKRNIKKITPYDCEEIRLARLKNKINSKFESRLNKQRQYKEVNSPVKSVESRPARERRLIQLADILTGAVGFHWNVEDRKENVKIGKLLLADYIASKLNRDSLRFSTKWHEKKFNIFYFDINKSKFKIK